MNYELLKGLEGKVVKVDRHGPHAAIGYLVHVGKDYFILLTKSDGLVIYKTFHVKSVTYDSKDELELDLNMPESFEFEAYTGDTFKDVLEQLILHWVKISPEKIEGVLDAVNNEYVTVIHKNEIIRVAMQHIRTVSNNLQLTEDGEDESSSNNDNNKGRRRRRG